MSWLVYADVKGGRETLNFSEWNKPQGDGAGDAVESVRNGSMPPIQYKPLHPAGRLTSADARDSRAGSRRRSLPIRRSLAAAADTMRTGWATVALAVLLVVARASLPVGFVSATARALCARRKW